MSGLISDVTGAAQGIGGAIQQASTALETLTAPLQGFASGMGPWVFGLRRASFRGVPFYVDDADGEGGRRIVVHEFPLVDLAYTEDMGRHAQRHRLRAVVLGSFYMAWRDTLLAACQDVGTPGVLIHPYLGTRTVRVGRVSWRESKERGGSCELDLEFVEHADQPSPWALQDTASQLLAAAGAIIATVSAAYGLVRQIMALPGLVSAFGRALVAQCTGRMLSLPTATVAGQQGRIRALPGQVDDDLGFPASLGLILSAAAVNVATATGAADPELEAVTVSGALPGAADLSGGLIGLAGWGASLTPVVGGGGVLAAEAAQQAALAMLVDGIATAAVLQVYAQVDWPSADAALAARDQVVRLLETQTQAAADLGLDDLYAAWQSTTTIALADLAERAQALPRLASYALPRGLPAPALAQRLYQTGARGGELAALNTVRHPLFMPRTGRRLIP